MSVRQRFGWGERGRGGGGGAGAGAGRGRPLGHGAPAAAARGPHVRPARRAARLHHPADQGASPGAGGGGGGGRAALRGAGAQDHDHRAQLPSLRQRHPRRGPAAGVVGAFLAAFGVQHQQAHPAQRGGAEAGGGLRPAGAHLPERLRAVQHTDIHDTVLHGAQGHFAETKEGAQFTTDAAVQQPRAAVPHAALQAARHDCAAGRRRAGHFLKHQSL